MAKINERFTGSGKQARSGSKRPKAGYKLGTPPGTGALRVPDVQYAEGSLMHDADAVDAARPVGGITKRSGPSLR